jgi:DMSO/TMAO reductase YedYZ molybdopterin-dependent catalytic subunit
MTPEKPAESTVLLVMDGVVENPLRLAYDDLACLPPEDQIPDVSALHPGRKGSGVDLRALLRRAAPKPEAHFVTLHADRDDFHVSIPLGEIRERGMIVYRMGDGPLDAAQGGPIRFLIRDPATCHTAELDDCANVKYLSRIELTTGRGRDTRPEDERAHAALHERQGVEPDDRQSG